MLDEQRLILAQYIDMLITLYMNKRNQQANDIVNKDVSGVIFTDKEQTIEKIKQGYLTRFEQDYAE